MVAAGHQVKVLSPMIRKEHWGRGVRLARAAAEVVGCEIYPMKIRQKFLHLWSEAVGRSSGSQFVHYDN